MVTWIKNYVSERKVHYLSKFYDKKPIRTVVEREEECVLLPSVEIADWSGGQIHTRADPLRGLWCDILSFYPYQKVSRKLEGVVPETSQHEFWLWYSFCLTDRNPQNFSQDQNDLKKFISANRIDAWNWKILGEHKITDVLNPQGKKKGEGTGQNKALGTNFLYRHTSSLEKGQMTDRSEEERAEAGLPKPLWIVPE